MVRMMATVAQLGAHICIFLCTHMYIVLYICFILPRLSLSRIASTSPLWKNAGTPAACSATPVVSRWNGNPHVTHVMATFIAKTIIIGKSRYYIGEAEGASALAVSSGKRLPFAASRRVGLKA